MTHEYPEDELILGRKDNPHHKPKHMKNTYKGRERGCTRNREMDLEISPTYGVIDITPVKLVPILRDLSKSHLPVELLKNP